MKSRNPSKTILLFVIGFLSVISFPPFPKYISPISFFGPILGFQAGLGKSLRRIRIPLIAVAVSLAGFVFSALINDQDTINRYSLSLVSVMLMFIACSSFSKGNFSFSIILLSGFSFGWLVWSLVFRTALTSVGFDFLWKYGIAMPATIALLVLGNRLDFPKIVMFLSICLVGIFSLFLNFRSHGIICLLAGGLFLVVSLNQSLNITRFGRRLVAIALLVVVLSPIAFLPEAMRLGYFGSTVQEKTVAQSDSGPLFFAGRNEPPLAFAIISERPIIGWGDLRAVPDSVVRSAVEMTRTLGMTDQDYIYRQWYRQGDSVDLHSVLSTYWAVGGIASAIFPLFMIFISIRAMIRYRGIWMLLIYYVALQVVWDCLFSPFDDFLVRFWGYAGVVLFWAGAKGSQLRSRRTAIPMRT